MSTVFDHGVRRVLGTAMSGLLLFSALGIRPARADQDSTATAAEPIVTSASADVHQMWEVRTGIDGARRVRVSTRLGTFEAQRLDFTDGQPFLTGVRGQQPPQGLAWHEVQQIEALSAGRPSPPSPPGRGGVVFGVLAVVAMAVVPAFVADDALEYSQIYLTSLGVLVGGTLVIGIPAYHLSSRWHTVYRAEDPRPQQPR